MSARPYNFSAGPAILPPAVLEQARDAVAAVGGGAPGLEPQLSILEISHRSPAYDEIHTEAVSLCHTVLGVPEDYRVLLLQGGASLQFAMVPMNLRHPDKAAAYIDTGAWSKKAIRESKVLGPTEVLASSAETGYDRIPAMVGPDAYANASYVHITTNNTIFGTEWAELPAVEGDVPLVIDCSSDIGSRPMAFDRVALGYAGAQKNLGPSGVTLVFMRPDLAEREPVGAVPHFLRYATHVGSNSLYNTPNTFGVLVLRAMLRWVRDEGGVEAIDRRNAKKADALYGVLDQSALYRPHAQAGSRSRMNVTWTIAGRDEDESAARTKRFLAGAAQAGLSGLKGHRSVGGCRASIYNAFPPQGVDALCEYLRAFERTA